MEDPVDILTLCRICLKDGEMVPIFDTMEKSLSALLSEMITICCGVTLCQSDELPSNICTTCLYDLKVAFQLRLTSEHSEAIFRSWEASSGETVDLSDGNQDDVELNREMKSGEVKGESEFEVDLLTCQEQDLIEDERELDPYYLNSSQETIEQADKDVLEEEQCPEMVKNEAQDVNQLIRVKSSNNQTPIPPKPVRKFSNRSPKKTSSVFYCDLCDKNFSRLDTFDVHRKRHNNEKTVFCSYCEKGFVNNFEMKRHQRSHTGDKPYKCNYCEKTFSDHASRKKHHNVHTKERPYSCTVCGKSFTYSNVLRAHMTIHTGEKKHKCSLCPKTFSQPHHLKKHTETHSKLSPPETIPTHKPMENVIEIVEETNWSSASVEDFIEHETQ